MRDAQEFATEPLPPRTSRVSDDEARAFLVSRFGNGVIDVEPIGGGTWSRAFSFLHDGAHYIARFGGFAEDFERDQWVGNHASADLPVPIVTEIGEAFGGYYAISERMFGDFIDHLDGEGMRAALPSLFSTLDAIRCVDLSTTTGYGTWNANS